MMSWSCSRLARLLRQAARNGFGSYRDSPARSSRCKQDLGILPLLDYFPSDFSMTSRLSSWFANAVQLREMFFSTVERRAEFVGSAPSFLYSAANALHCSTERI